MEIYVVQQGDSVERISRIQNVRAEEVIYINQLVYPYTLAVGQALLIPTASWQENSRPLAMFWAMLTLLSAHGFCRRVCRI